VRGIDTCGTGGGEVPTFNVSTAAALVAVGAGATVAKHGNRSYTTRCGSADVLEALGVNISLDARAAGDLLRRARIAFLFAPAFHPAMRFVGPVRRELAVPTVMNLVGPLANPASVRHQIVGVGDRSRAPLVAEALRRLGTEHALVVHADVGMDEIAPAGRTAVWEVRGHDVEAWTVEPATFGLEDVELDALAGEDPPANATRITRLLEQPNADRAARNAVLLNAAAALYVAGLADTMAGGIELARAALEDGRAADALACLVRESRASTSE
jgi:anthranilate phosphoribosyltransferase